MGKATKILQMRDYYSEKLNSNKLQRCYEVAPERVKQFLEEEIGFVLERIDENDIVLDLGCGYGRVSVRLSEKAKQVVGVDVSEENIKLANKQYKLNESIDYLVMDASDLKFVDNFFDVTICIQNGVSAFKIDPKRLISEALRVTKKKGVVLISSYSEQFWNERIEWFQIQAAEGLIGEIDYNLTRKGTIVCKDGFRAITFTKNDFTELATHFDADTEIYEVDNSSVFCEMKKR
ncbi:MAG: methyltransferase domain-containing protein [Lentimicrobiaceae bacterium]|nr:methyltransferase domain-containing protein [Lentimicrobiaceae bacterium]